MQENYKLLIIDDSAEALMTINNYLLNSKYNYEILNATNGNNAKEIIEQEMPDLIVTDWDMPEMNGLELITYLQSVESLRHIPVIICSGVMVESQNIIDALNCGAIDFLKKPFSEMELIARINSKLLFIETLKKLKAENQKRIFIENLALLEKIELQNANITSKALTLGKFNDLLRFILTQLTLLAERIKIETDDDMLQTLVNQINMSLNKDSWEDFLFYFNSLHPNFINNLILQHSDLSPNEVKMCVLLKFNLNTKQISSITQQTIRSIEMARHRLRQKLFIDKDDNLTIYLNSL